MVTAKNGRIGKKIGKRPRSDVLSLVLVHMIK